MMETWIDTSISEIVLQTKLKDPTKEPEKQFYYIDVSSVSNDLLRIESPTLMFGKDAPSRARKLIHHEDTIFATVRPTLKRIAIVPKDFHGQVCSTGYCVLKPNREKVDPYFLYFSLLPDYFIEKLGKLQRGASYPAIRDSDLKLQRLCLPPLPEQRKITYILSTVQKAIEQQDKLIRTTTELKKAMMEKLFTEGIKGDKQKKTELGLVPESWDIVDMSTIVDFKTGKLDSNAAVEGGAYPFFTCAQETFRIDKYAFDQEAILLSGNNARAIYSVKHYKGKFNAYQRTYVITIRNEADYDYLFLKHALTRQLEYLRTISIGSQTRYLTLGMLTTLKMLKPDLEMQRFIGKTINQLDKKLNNIISRKQLLSDLFKTLLHELMTGQRRVHEIDFENQLQEAAHA